MNTLKLEQKRQKKNSASLDELKRAIDELNEIKKNKLSIEGRLFNGTVGAVSGFVAGGPAGAVVGGVKGLTAKDPIEAGTGGLSAGAGTSAIAPDAGGDIGKTFTAALQPGNLEKTGNLIGNKDLANIGKTFTKEKKEADKTAFTKKKYEDTRKDKAEELAIKKEGLKIKKEGLGIKTENAKTKSIISARDHAIKAYDKKVTDGIITDSEETFKGFIRDRVMAEIEGKYPEYKTTKAGTKKKTTGHLWWKKEIDKVVKGAERKKTGKYIKPDKFVVGKTYVDGKGNKAKYLGNGEWREI